MLPYRTIVGIISQRRISYFRSTSKSRVNLVEMTALYMQFRGFGIIQCSVNNYQWKVVTT